MQNMGTWRSLVTSFNKISLESFEIYNNSFQNAKTNEKNPKLYSVFGTFGFFIKCVAQMYMSSLSPVRL